jgi:type III pantothenate kinase
MVLAVDIGNTSITLCLFRGGNGGRLSVGRIPTEEASQPRRLARALRRRLRGFRLLPGQAEAVVIASVVPAATRSFEWTAREMGLPRARVLGRDLKAPVTNRYRIPSQVGQDRLVNAAAAFVLYRGPAIVVDFGTAVTIDGVSARREYLGGLILPGMEVALAALVQRTALLPSIPFVPPREFLGRDTQASMRSGLFHGYAVLCDGLVNRLRREHLPRAKVVATGGYAGRIAPLCRSIQVVNPSLTLQGLDLSYRLSLKK